MSGLTTSTAYRLLATLEATGYITREHRSRSYIVGDELVRISARVMNSFSLAKVARPVMEQLVELTSETVTLHIPNGHLRTCVATVEGKHTIRRIIEVGETMPLSVGPSGKIILAFYEPEERAAILADSNDPDLDLKKLERQIQAIHRDGYLRAVADRTPGVASMSIPVMGPNGILASMTVSGPSNRWTMEAMAGVAPEVVALVADLSRSLGAPPASAGSRA